jgi:hypothetical protein
MVEIICSCGATLQVDNDQLILSQTSLVRVHALSNHSQSGTVTIDKPGYSFKITFSEPFNVVCKPHFIADQPVTAKELFIEGAISIRWMGRRSHSNPNSPRVMDN